MRAVGGRLREGARGKYLYRIVPGAATTVVGGGRVPLAPLYALAHKRKITHQHINAHALTNYARTHSNAHTHAYTVTDSHAHTQACARAPTVVPLPRAVGFRTFDEKTAERYDKTTEANAMMGSNEPNRSVAAVGRATGVRGRRSRWRKACGKRRSTRENYATGYNFFFFPILSLFVLIFFFFIIIFSPHFSGPVACRFIIFRRK